ncbi:metallophosphoesterase family protein [Mucilaginibacter sp. FT3.2]|uniref:metallophosphoesterase family protein n=1 Tax=Mucilaginibacter sp. FT3.2 TaxID=2723090 RepID=UPI0016108074|nr:metallophosphoesterase [Mucilaginibacter sp. FT3.2]MBB6231344.1 putative MPP superfamily phosphohydrolase [Mucilaginibacter sp. FT3.2]
MKSIIHLSDLHFRNNWEEDQEVLLSSFFKDLEKQLKYLNPQNVFIAFSGDVVLAGGDSELYTKFLERFDADLNNLNIPISQRICIPGNHDVSRNYVSEKEIEHEGIISQNLTEKKFNDYMFSQPEIILKKFENYELFEQLFSQYGIAQNITGRGWDLGNGVSIYCLNTALLSSGGFNNINDRGRLLIDTRSLQKWLQKDSSSTKILMMHHPLDWLANWSQIELEKILKNSFSLCLSGHVHDQSHFHLLSNDHRLTMCSAPPLLTNKKDHLGYSIINVDQSGILEINYRQWTKNYSFVTGVNFSNTDDGKVIIQEKKISKFEKKEFKLEDDFYPRLLVKRFNDSLKSFSSQPIIWVEPFLSASDEFSLESVESEEDRVNISSFIENIQSTIIKAPPQFGLSCLSFYLTKEAWTISKSIWLRIDFRDLKLHNIQKVITQEAESLSIEIENVNCIIIDSWVETEKDSTKIINKIIALYGDLPLIIMHTVDGSKFRDDSNERAVDRKFNVLHLLALSRSNIRKVVSAYNDQKHIGEEDAIIAKVTSDLEVLNIHRTPLNCLTLLKVSEKSFDDSPVNRTEMIKMILFLLFDMEEIPTYKSRPDLKDCEYVLGYFCEKMIKSMNFLFLREQFLNDVKNFCSERVIDLDAEVVFDVLHSNNIIVKRNSFYQFKFSYWIYYFGAQRMQHSPNFSNYIFENKRYINFPEMVEFYTGIDRSREDALKILTTDLKITCDIVDKKVGLPEGMNPYRLITWRPTSDGIEKMRNEIGEGVQNSNLPDTVKDKYADRDYDNKRPYDQSIHTILNDYSVVILMQSIKTSSRALRNSDYVDPSIKRELMIEIMRSWEQMSKVLMALTPMLALKGNADFDGAAFSLIGNFGETVEDKINSILQNIPFNIMYWFKNDLFSRKMGPLIYQTIALETNDLKRHELYLLTIYERPRDWNIQLQNYIASISKNSFYLFDVYSALMVQYRYSFVAPKAIHEIRYLIKMCLAKHELGGIKPGIDLIKKISDDVFPDRNVDSY